MRKRLRWRVRRGTRELDRMLGGWLEQHFDQADSATQHAFDALLDVQDPQLWAWLSGADTAPREEWQRIIDEIRTSHRL